MDLIKNIQRIAWRFSAKKPFTPNDSDVEAMNSIITWINKEKETRVNENRYFAKILVYCYIQELNFYKNNNSAEKKINEILEKPLEYWYSEFRKQMNRMNFNQMVEMVGLKSEWEKADNDHGLFGLDQIQVKSPNQELIKNNEADLVKVLKGNWDQEKINSKLNFFISELLNEYANRP